MNLQSNYELRLERRVLRDKVTEVQRRRAEYAVWSDDVLEFDTSGRTAGEIAGALSARLGIVPME